MKVNKWFRRAAALTLAIVLASAAAVNALACTGIYAGSDVTDDGSVYVGRSEDFGPSYNKIFEVVPAADHEPGEMLVENWNGEADFSMPYPAHTLQYSIMRDVREVWGVEDDTIPYAEAGMNECGVCVSATVSTYHNEKITAIDPLCWDEGEFEYFSGISEYAMGSVILQSARTAREGVEILAAVIDEYGAAECNAIFIADANEVWYFEIVSGHQYAAIKLDTGKVSVVPNMMMLDQIDVTDENVVASRDLITVAKAAGSYYTEEPDNENSIHVAKSYSEGYPAHSSYRAWMGMNVLNAELAATVDPDPVSGNPATPNADRASASGPFELQFDPAASLGGKINLKTMIQVLQSRGEGTKYNAGDGYYPIGNAYQAEDHIFQIRQNLPASIAAIQWQAMGPAEFSIFIPYYTAALTQTPEIYHNESMDFTYDSMYWVFDELAALCNENRDTNVDEVVKAYFSDVQDSLIAQQKLVDEQMQKLAGSDPDAVSAKAEELANSIAAQVYAIALQTLREVENYLDAESEDPFTLTLQKENVLPVYRFSAEEADLSAYPVLSVLLPIINAQLSGTFVDVTTLDYCYDAVNWAVRNGITTGTSRYTFSPDGVCTRAQAVTFLWRAAGCPESETSTTQFADVDEGAYYAKAVAWAVENGVTNGTSATTFSPDATCTRAQIVTLLYRALGSETRAQIAFTDVAADAYYAGAVAWASANEITCGTSDTTFSPNVVCTRAQIVTLLYRAAQLVQ